MAVTNHPPGKDGKSAAQPRQMCVHSDSFGRHWNASFRKKDDEGHVFDVRELTAAVMHHRIVVRIREQMAAHNLSQDQYAERAKRKPNQLTRVLCGYQRMTFADFAVACRIFGPQIAEKIDADDWYTTLTANDGQVRPLTELDL